LIASVGGFDIYNWDTGNYPISAIGLILLLRYTEKKTFTLLLLSSGTIGLMTAFRITNLTIFPIWFIIIWSVNFKLSIKKRIILIAVAVSISMLMWSLCAIIMADSLQNYVHAFSSENIISGHGTEDLKNWIWRFKTLFPIRSSHWIPFSLCFICACLISKIKYLRSYFNAAAFFLCAFSGWIALKITGLILDFGSPMFTIGFPIAIILILHIPYKKVCYNINYTANINRNPNTLKLQLFIATTFVLLLGLGSDAMFERWNTSFIIPITLGIIWNYLDNFDKSIFLQWYKYSIFTIFTIFTIKYYHTNKEFSDIDITFSQKEHVYVMNEFVDTYQEIDSIINKFPIEDKFGFWGIHGKPLTYLYEDSPVFPMQLFHPQIKDTLILKNNWDKIDWLFILKDPSGENHEELELFSYITNSKRFKLESEKKGFVLFHKQ